MNFVCAIGRAVVSLFLLAIGCGMIVSIQYIGWYGPKLLQMEYGVDSKSLGISPIVAIPLLLVACIAFVSSVFAWTYPCSPEVNNTREDE